MFFLDIKQIRFITPYLDTDKEKKTPNSWIEEYLCIFPKFNENKCQKVLLMTEFAFYKNKNNRTDYRIFWLNDTFHLFVFYKWEINFQFILKAIYKLAMKEKKLTIVYEKNLWYTQKV